jgi:hypothetical protein
MVSKVRKILGSACIAVAMLSLAINSHAATISGYAIGSFNSAVDQNGALLLAGSGSSKFTVSNSDNGSTSIINWGTPQNHGSNGKSNYFIFNGNASDTYQSGTYGSTILGDLFSLGSFEYHNGKTRQDHLTQVNFRVDMGIDGLMQMTTGTFGSAYLEFTMSLNNTNDNNDPIASADSVWVSAVSVGMTMPDGTSIYMPYDFATGMDMMIGGEYYNFSLMGFSRDGGLTFESQATSLENETTSAEIFASITQVTPVPLPAAVWLMGSGLIGLIGLGYRRKK